MFRTAKTLSWVLILAGFALPLLIFKPLQNFPYVHDWTSEQAGSVAIDPAIRS
jgi:hypothetical protein